ncbi:IucA/IucC family siderophore biosynthesis protein [Actinoplanes sp. KI2]|uniref:IucA/IucC family siderophore biosynthesis protein n=1 Tax=Actinoplanes sp. KI2 TaxID=2983315 RepID=UPI0021D5A720|nr:IucA/IucC family siderophore biosynthesis protein [Actinoplanes sp. KI2]MCU7722467.1 IucA/IucC family siderophore biosynthesis protein [Actinoplanes sp. KI2]
MPRPTSESPPIRHTADPTQTREDLAVLRPDLVEPYDAELAGARAAVLGRLLGALDREPLPGLGRRRAGEVSFPGVTVRYPRAAAAPFAPAGAGLEVTVRADTAPGDEPDEGRQPAWLDSDAWVHELSPGAFITDPGTLVRVLWPGSDLAAEIDNSVANLALARAAATRHDPAALLKAPDPDGLARAEQSIVDGHPLHPCCRTRGGMSVADVLAYAPEHSPTIRLRRLRVPADRWHGTAEPVLLAHPWQAERIRDAYPWLADAGETGPVRPLMSLRTVATAGGGPHVKTAVDVQMTSAVRTVSPAAVENGPNLSRLLRLVLHDLPIDVLAETAAGVVLIDGLPQRHLAFLVREAPWLAPGEVVVPIALFGAHPALLGTVPDPYEMMGLLGRLLFAPLARVLDRGIALEAHGQNTLVVLRDGRPVRILYRDLGGVRVSARRLAGHGFEAPPLRGDLPSDDPAVLRTKLAAAALGTVAAELVAALTRRGADPHRLWGIVAAALTETGTADVPHLLREPLPVKATTAMRLAADPLDDIWAGLDNPLAVHA